MAGNKLLKTQKKYTVLILDEEIEKNQFAGSAFEVITSSDIDRLGEATSLIIVVRATRMAEISSLIRQSNRKNHLKALIIRSDVDLMLLSQLMNEAEVRSLDRTLFYQQTEEIHRVLNAWKTDGEEQLIAQVSVVGGFLYVISCALELYRVSFESIPALRALDQRIRQDFALAEDGRYLHWPEPDIHLDIETIRYHTDPEFKLKIDLESHRRNKQLGENIKRNRKNAGLRQSDIPGMSGRQVRRIENGESRITVKSLKKLAQAHQMEVEEYMRVVSSRVGG